MIHTWSFHRTPVYTYCLPIFLYFATLSSFCILPWSFFVTYYCIKIWTEFITPNTKDVSLWVPQTKWKKSYLSPVSCCKKTWGSSADKIPDVFISLPFVLDVSVVGVYLPFSQAEDMKSSWNQWSLIQRERERERCKMQFSRFKCFQPLL